MKAPQFWHQNNLISKLLSWSLLPFSLLYLLSHLFSFYSKKAKKTKQPIICIGNLIAGGAGKTPVAIQIGKICQSLGIDFCYLSGGYRSSIKKFTAVNRFNHSFKKVGDEPLLLSEIESTFISKNRVLACNLITQIYNQKSLKEKIVITDDGWQDSSFIKDFAILVIDGNYGFGNGLTIPSGPLREPIKYGIKRADLIIMIGQDKQNIVQNFCNHKEIIHAEIKPINYQKFINKSAIAFCGIGRPEKFFFSLNEIKVNIISKFSYPDHHQYQEKELVKMLNLAKKNQAIIITTKKDWVRLDKVYKQQIQYLEIEVEFQELNHLQKKLIQLNKNK